jgi:putative protease
MGEAIYLRINPKHVHYLNRVMEGYEYLGIVSTVNRNAGIVIIRTTADTVNEVRNIVAHLDIPIEVVHDEELKNFM